MNGTQFTKLKEKDESHYELWGTNLPQGTSVTMIKLCFSVLTSSKWVNADGEFCTKHTNTDVQYLPVGFILGASTDCTLLGQKQWLK